MVQYTIGNAIFCPVCEVPIPPKKLSLTQGLLTVWECTNCHVNWVMNGDSGILMRIGIIRGSYE